jgi:Uma2 family endonuclease
MNALAPPIVVPREPRPRRRPFALVLSDSYGQPEIDWSSWYLEDEENHVETPEHFLIGDVIHTSIEVLRERRLGVFASADAPPMAVMRNTVFAWMRHEEKVRVCPDVYVIANAPDPLPRSFKTWLDGHHAPDLAFEVVSDEREKEYEVNPAKYASLGTKELVIYDPRRFGSRWKGEEVAPIQRYLRRDDGLFERVESGVDSVFCATLDVWLVSVRTPDGYRLRLALDPDGRAVVPTRDEAHAEMKGLAEHERAEKERERAEKERERAEKDRLSRRLRELGVDPDAIA